MSDITFLHVGIDQLDLDEHAGAELAGGIGYVDACPHRSRVAVDLCAQVRDRARENITREGVDPCARASSSRCTPPRSRW